MIATVLEIKSTAVMEIPRIVALGIVLVGFFTCSEGMVADSSPKKAHSVKAAVVVSASKAGSLLRFKGLK